MPMMTLRRTFRLATTKGHSVQFVADTPIFVPSSIAAEAVAIGAIAVDGTDIDITPKGPPQRNAGPAEAAEREAEILEAINLLVQRNARDDFTAGGSPKARALSALLGYEAERREVDEVWSKRAEMIAAGELGSDGEKV